MIASAFGGVHASAVRTQPHGGGSGSFGVVTIWADGTVSNPSAPISVSGSTYTLTGELNGSLVVLASSVTVDGAGYLVNYTVGEAGGDGAAVSINSTSYTTVENFLSANDSIGVLAWNTSFVTLQGNQVSGSMDGILVNDSEWPDVQDNNVSGSPVNGIELNYTDDANVIENNATGTAYGVYIANSSYAWAIGNVAPLSDYGIYVSSSPDAWVYANDVQNDTNGVSIIYSSFVTATGNSANWSMNGLGSSYSHDIQFTDNYASNTNLGIASYECQNVMVSGNLLIQDSEPMSSEYSGQVTFANNYAPYNLNYGIFDYEDSGLMAVGNYVPLAASGEYGVYSDYSMNVTYLDNNFSGDYYGIYDYESGAFTASGNNLTGAEYGFYMYYAYGWTAVTGNNVTGDVYGIYSYEPNGPLNITGNVGQGCEYGVYSEYNDGSMVVAANDLQDNEYAVYFYEPYGQTVVQSNNLSGSEYGVYAYQDYAPLTVTDNNISTSVEGVYAYETYGGVVLSGNDIQDCWIGTYLDASYGIDMIAGNEFQGSGSLAIDDFANDGGMVIEGNNASGSYNALYVEDANLVNNEITGNNLSNSYHVYLGNETIGNGFFDNNMLNVSNINITDTVFASFYHNDINSSGFVSYDSTCDCGSVGTWNDAYPVGGNFWTGYSGVDEMYGVLQNQPGSDGIGDTPYYVGGIEDQYPLMYEWLTPMLTFNESGLPAGTTWSVNFNGVDQNGTAGGLISFPETQGAYSVYFYSIDPIPGYVSSPSSGLVFDYGKGARTSIVFTPFTYAVNFTESGLPAGTSWSVTIGSTTNTSTQSWIVLDEPNGTWTYTVGSVAGYLTTTTGQVTVNAAPMAVSVVFVPMQHAVYFNETGLVAGTSWSVTIGATVLATAGDSVVFSLADGSYAYTVGPVPGFTTTWSGIVKVTGTAAAVLIAFVPTTYQLTISESGLPSGTSWSVTLDGLLSTSTSPAITLMLQNGTYGYVPGNVTGYITPAPGSLAVAGSNTSVTITYGPVIRPTPIYTVAVTEVGLPLGAGWSATLGSSTVIGTTTVLLFYVPNGTYAFTASATGYQVEGPSTVFVSGADKVVSVAFSAPPTPVYTVSFTESGLPTGTTWYVTLGTETLSSSLSTIGFLVENGTYAFTVGSSVGYIPAPSSGQKVVNGSPLNVAIDFTAVTPAQTVYAIAVTETGLSAGATWSASVANTTASGSGTTLWFYMPNGTYSFSAKSTGYEVQGPVNVAVVGIDQVVVVVFTQPTPATYTLSFTETGLPSGTTWYVWMGQTIHSTDSTNVTFTVPNGTYSYMVGTTNSYVPTPASGQKVVSGSAASVSVSFTAPPSTGTTTQGAPDSEVYGLVAGLIAAAVVAVVGWVMFIRKPPTPAVPVGPRP
jgi:parallel beta-helix repeat protein